jgi:hypothetical protein
VVEAGLASDLSVTAARASFEGGQTRVSSHLFCQVD